MSGGICLVKKAGIVQDFKILNLLSTDMNPSLSRRSFLQKSSLVTAGLAAPNLFLTRKAAAAENVVIGEGEHKYECIHYWGELPEAHNYGGASHGVAFDSQGLVYVSHQGKPGSVFVFEPSGKFIRAIAQIHEGAGHGIDIRKESDGEFIYLAANGSGGNGGIAKLTLTGEVVWRKNGPPESHKYDDGKGWNFTNISFIPDGGFHAGDGYGRNFIHRYDKEGNYLTSFGGTGTENGKFKTPHGHWLDERDGTPKLAVCDRANGRLQYFTVDGQYLSTVPNIDGPASLDIRGNIMLCTEVFIGRLVLLDKRNNVICRLNDDPEWIKKIKGTPNFRGLRDQWLPGKFVHPHDATFDKDGNIFIAEWVVGGRVSKLRKVS